TEYITPIDKLPEPSWSCEIAGGVTEEAAKETGLVPGTKVIRRAGHRVADAAAASSVAAGSTAHRPVPGPGPVARTA
ncbi:MAG: hypothetical protein S0880_14950, partial [Actinomycetota bacterium]|nr:hypothetical protein [Actinomycetota bacterium]